MRDQIETFDQQIETLGALCVEHDLADGMSGHITGLTCDLHLYGDQVPTLTRIIRLGLDADARAIHPTPAHNTGAA